MSTNGITWRSIENDPPPMPDIREGEFSVSSEPVLLWAGNEFSDPRDAIQIGVVCKYRTGRIVSQRYPGGSWPGMSATHWAEANGPHVPREVLGALK